MLKIHFIDTKTDSRHRFQAQPCQDILLAPRYTQHCHHVAYQPHNQSTYDMGKQGLANASPLQCNDHGPTPDGLVFHGQRISRPRRSPLSIVCRPSTLLHLICLFNLHLRHYKPYQLLALRANTTLSSTTFHVFIPDANHTTRAPAPDQPTIYHKHPTRSPSSMAIVRTTPAKN
jgi:hypothetical protein